MKMSLATAIRHCRRCCKRKLTTTSWATTAQQHSQRNSVNQRCQSRNSVSMVISGKSHASQLLSPLSRSLSTISASLFDEICSETLHVLADSLEELPDFIPDLPESFDIEYNGEVLTLHIKDGQTYVINRQTPNQQIWLSSPISGPKRYDFIDGDWVYSHDGTKMIDLLEGELSDILDFEFELNDVRHCLLAFT